MYLFTVHGRARLPGPSSRRHRAARFLRAAGAESPADRLPVSWRLNSLCPAIVAGPIFRAGYEEGRNLLIEWRFAEGHVGRLRELADELVRLKVELIVAGLNEATDEAKQATQTIPIVMFSGSFPVERGIVTSLAHREAKSPGRFGGQIHTRRR